MKKSLSWYLLLLIGVLFVACSDDEKVSKNDLIGEWECVHSMGYFKENGIIDEEWDTDQPPTNMYENDYNMVGSIYLFNADGTYTFWLAPYYTSWSGEWKVSGSKLIFTDDDGDSERITIVSLTKNKLVLEDRDKDEEHGIVYEDYERHTFAKVSQYQNK